MIHVLSLCAVLAVGTSIHPKAGPFALVDAKGNKVTNDDLRGKAWVAHFFFTTCTGDCTKTAPVMRELQKQIAGMKDYSLVSFSLNNDSGDDLKRYAEDIGAVPGQWFFLTGPKADVHKIVQDSFFLTAMDAAKPKPGAEIDHSPKLAVIGPNGNIVGYVDGTNPDAVAQVRQMLRHTMESKYALPAMNARLNALCTVLLLAGYIAIRKKQELLHKVLMLSALVVSIVFLASYLYFHFVVLGGEPTRFREQGIPRVIYFTILITHVALATLFVAPLAPYVTYLGLRDYRARHVRIVRWLFPIWVYVSITGVVVYWMLYHLYPPI